MKERNIGIINNTNSNQTLPLFERVNPAYRDSRSLEAYDLCTRRVTTYVVLSSHTHKIPIRTPDKIFLYLGYGSYV
jgi:hypothetical protein